MFCFIEKLLNHSYVLALNNEPINLKKKVKTWIIEALIFYLLFLVPLWPRVSPQIYSFSPFDRKFPFLINAIGIFSCDVERGKT